MLDLLKSLAGCKNVASLRAAMQFGEIGPVDILTMKQPGKRQALCFLRPESASQEQQLMANLGVSRFGSELLFVVDLPAEQADMQWTCSK